jgi:HSP20 family protein
LRDIVRKKGSIIHSSPETSITTSEGHRRLSREFDTIFDQFRNAFDDLMTPFFPTFGITTPIVETDTRYPYIDLSDNEENYILTAELPGFKKDMVDVQINRDSIQIRAEKKVETDDKKKNYMRHERAYTSFERNITFPEEVNPSKVEGNMKDGVLELTIPKKEVKPEEKMIKISLK